MILSVPHTGTRSLEKITGYTHLHSYAYMTPQDILNRNQNEVMVVPLREPWAVWTTWFQRYGGRKYIMDPDHPKSMESAWRALAALDRYFDLHYIPVDIPGVRDEQLELLSEKMGRKLVSDWIPVGARPEKKKTLQPGERNLDFVYNMPFVRRFYG